MVLRNSSPDEFAYAKVGELEMIAKKIEGTLNHFFKRPFRRRRRPQILRPLFDWNLQTFLSTNQNLT